MKALLRQLAWWGLLGAGLPLVAQEPRFAVTITGHRQIQEHGFQNGRAGQDQGYVFVMVPAQAAPNGTVGSDPSSEEDFYVLVRNVSSNSIRLNLADSDWYDSLEFTVIVPDGKIFIIHRPPTAWTINWIESWIFQPGGFRVFTVDFTKGRWQGFPSQTELPPRSRFRIKATFTYYDWEQKKQRRYESDFIAAQNRY